MSKRVNWDNCKVRIKDETESRKVQERLFELGYGWRAESRQIILYPKKTFWIYTIGKIMFWSSSEYLEHLSIEEEVTVADILGERFNFDGVPTYTPEKEDKMTKTKLERAYEDIEWLKKEVSKLSGNIKLELQKTLWDKRKYPTSAGSVYRDEDVKEAFKELMYCFGMECVDSSYFRKEAERILGKELVE